MARLSNALYGSALVHVMTAEGTAILLHYTAMRLAAELRGISERLPVDLGGMGAAPSVGEALKLLLEVCTVRSVDDPRADAVTTNLSRAADQLTTAAERIDTLFSSYSGVCSGGRVSSSARARNAVTAAASRRITDGSIPANLGVRHKK